MNVQVSLQGDHGNNHFQVKVTAILLRKCTMSHRGHSKLLVQATSFTISQMVFTSSISSGLVSTNPWEKDVALAGQGTKQGLAR